MLTIVEPDLNQPSINLDAVKEAAKLLGWGRNTVTRKLRELADVNPANE